MLAAKHAGNERCYKRIDVKKSVRSTVILFEKKKLKKKNYLTEIVRCIAFRTHFQKKI